MTNLTIAFTITNHVKVCSNYGYTVLGKYVKHSNGAYEVWLKGNRHMETNCKLSLYEFCIDAYMKEYEVCQDLKVPLFREFMKEHGYWAD